MNQGSAPPPDRLAATLAWIEQHLDATLTLDVIAREAGLSPYHFSRMFTGRMSSSLVAYVRGRRLLKTAKWMVNDSQLNRESVTVKSRLRSSNDAAPSPVFDLIETDIEPFPTEPNPLPIAAR